MARVIDVTRFPAKKLLFTRLDETERYGALISEVGAASDADFVSGTGQKIPDDLEPATKASSDVVRAGKPRSNSSEPHGASEHKNKRMREGSPKCSESKSVRWRYGATALFVEEREQLILEHLPQVRLIARRFTTGCRRASAWTI